MKKLPNAVKWLIILVVLGAMGAMMWAVNDRASRVEMPAPGQHLWHLPYGRERNIIRAAHGQRPRPLSHLR